MKEKTKKEKKKSLKDKEKKVIDQANDYFPVQSDSERAAGHPIVGVS